MDTEKIKMKIAVLSGKGGTGKTLISVNLASVAKKATYLDCDVEEPNGYIFFKPVGISEENVAVKIPSVHLDLCNGCRKCLQFCKFNALAYIKEKLIIFNEVCHSCGGCVMICPQKALVEKDKIIGNIQKGTSEQVIVHTGTLNTGETSGIPIIKKMLENHYSDSSNLTFIDCPPGSACIVMESIKEADYCIIVAEPTLFGVHNLSMVYELVLLFNKPFGVVLNKCLKEDNPAEKFCLEKGINILAYLPFDKELGLLTSNGKIVARESDTYNSLFSSLLDTVKKEVLQLEAITHFKEKMK